MAVKWAVANGNWNVGTTWNDGVVPAVVDEVYLNGHTITLPNNANIAAAKISNCSNEDISVVNGGELYSSYINATITIIANIDADTYGIINCGSTAGGLLIINGNITCTNLLASESLLKRQNTSTSRFSIHINGNCIIDGSGVFIDGNSSNISDLGIILNGNVTIGDNITFTKGWSASPLGIIQINGNLFIGINCDSLNADYIISGNSFVKSTINCRNLTLGGSVEYASTSGTFGFKYDNLLILNPDTFTWRDISEPRINPFIIITDWDLNNQIQYPPENSVVAGTPYAFDEKVGTFAVDYPPETVVLKDYVYDNGEMVGTLDLPQVPTTSDIVTAIKNDSDLGGKIDTTNTNVGNISTAVTTIDGKVDIIDTSVDTLLSRLTSVLTQRLGQSVTVEILQQILVAHLDN